MRLIASLRASSPVLLSASRAMLCALVAIALTPAPGCGGSSAESLMQGTGIGQGAVPIPQGPGFNLGLGPLDPDAMARAAVLLGSCAPDDGINRILEGLYSDRQAGEEFLLGSIACLSTKTNGCQALADCLGVLIDSNGPCTKHCEGDTTVACDDQLRFRQDCSRIGLKCVEGDDDCRTATPGPSCDSSFQGTCESGRPQSCSGPTGQKHVTSGLLCSDFGLVCATSPSSMNLPACQGSGGACTSSSVSYGGFDVVGTGCQGTSLQACINGGSHVLDCAEVGKGFTCQQVSSSYFCGLAAECDAGRNSSVPTPTATCDGTSVVLCNAGKATKIDCKSLGFTGCEPKYGICIPTGFTG